MDSVVKGSPFATAYFCRDLLPKDLIVEKLVTYEKPLVEVWLMSKEDLEYIYELLVDLGDDSEHTVKVMERLKSEIARKAAFEVMLDSL